ncbi:putative bifunctional diguanylate cyclase/phosphodiesterase [Dactylosporangium sp. CS-033363]|uniref:putative bifunctional diguanylate cyclase/phosphodiesterase n=1 Tax=Dactylosporangium sp. CS-033363 TaxID=3239935 RepID=UPI003D8AEFD9
MWNHRRLLTAAGLLFAGLVAVRLADLFDTKAAGISLCLLETVALGFHLRAATSRRLAPDARRPFRFTSAALALLVVAGVGFSIAFTTGDKTWGPATVLAIVPRVLVTPVLLLGLLSFAAKPMDRRARWKLAMDVATVLGAGAMLMWYLVLGPALQSGGLLDPLRLGAVLFAVGDVVLLVGVGTVLLRGSVLAARTPLVLLLAGTVGYLVVDTIFLYSTVRDIVQDALVPSLLHLPMFLILLAALVRQTARDGAVVADRPLRRVSWLPYLALAGGYALLTVAAIRAGLFPWLGLIGGALVMTLGVAARQIVASRENYTLVITDSLTGLANRLQLRGALGAALDRHRRSGSPLAVLLIDLNGFKQVNDAYGHEVGDQMLTAFADVLRRSVRDGDVPARLGGDEFAVVLPDVHGTAGAIAVAERILEACRPLVHLSGHTLRLRPSIGVALAARDADQSEVLHRADLAMYAAKRRDEPSWTLYSAAAMDAERAETVLARELALAVQEQQFILLYRPIVELSTATVTGVEAQVRWRHPARGLLEPAAFVPVAEATGLIHDIGSWALRTACRQVAEWRLQGQRLYLTMPMSPAHLRREALGDDVLRVLGVTGLDAEGLVLGVGESALLGDPAAVTHLERLRTHGVRIALDEVGPGYADLPVDLLRLDRSFLAELNGGGLSQVRVNDVFSPVELPVAAPHA